MTKLQRALLGWNIALSIALGVAFGNIGEIDSVIHDISVHAVYNADRIDAIIQQTHLDAEAISAKGQQRWAYLNVDAMNNAILRLAQPGLYD